MCNDTVVTSYRTSIIHQDISSLVYMSGSVYIYLAQYIYLVRYISWLSIYTWFDIWEGYTYLLGYAIPYYQTWLKYDLN